MDLKELYTSGISEDYKKKIEQSTERRKNTSSFLITVNLNHKVLPDAEHKSLIDKFIPAVEVFKANMVQFTKPRKGHEDKYNSQLQLISSTNTYEKMKRQNFYAIHTHIHAKFNGMCFIDVDKATKYFNSIVRPETKGVYIHCKQVNDDSSITQYMGKTSS